MKGKYLKVIKLLLTSFSFVIALLLLFNLRVKAADTTDFYYPNSALASGYNQDGEAILNEAFDIYAYNNGTGYQIDNKKARISSVKITNGSYTKTFNVNDKNFANLVKIYNGVNIPDDGEYGTNLNLSMNKTDLIRLNLKEMLAESTNASNNNVTIEIKLEKVYSVFGITAGWVDYGYTLISYKGGVKQASNIVEFTKTNTAFAKDKLEITSVEISKDGLSCVNQNKGQENSICYNFADYNVKKKISLTITTNFKFSGTIRVYYNSNTYLSLKFSKQNSRTIDLSSLISENTEKEYNFSRFTLIEGKDIYESTMTGLKYEGKSASFFLDTKKPTITKAGISNTSSVNQYYDLVEIYPTFEFSEDVNFTISSLIFDVGGTRQTKSCASENCSAIGKAITQTYYLSGNGLAKLIGFVVTISDMYGNETSYDEQTSTGLCNSNDEVILVSSIISIETSKTYYYNGEQIDIVVTLTNADVNLGDFNLIRLVLSDGSEYKFTSYNKVSNKVHYTYNVGNKNLTVSKMEFYKPYEVESNQLVVYEQELNITMNTYLDLKLAGKTLTNPESLVIYQGDNLTSFDTSKIALDSHSTTILNCSKVEGRAICNYSASEDSENRVIVHLGAIVLSNGIKNNEEEFTFIINTRAPVLEFVLGDNIVEYGDKLFYKNGINAINFNLNDGYASSSCLYYKFDDGEYTPNCDKMPLTIPQTEGEHSFAYYTSDGVNQSQEVIYEKKFVYRDAFYLNDIQINVNEVELTNLDSVIDKNKYFNYLNVAYQGANNLDLLAKFEVLVYVKNTLTDNSNLDSHTFSLTKEELLGIEDEVSLKLVLTDKLGNELTYQVVINIDTIDPSFDLINVELTNIGENHKVTISGYDEYEAYVMINDERQDLDETGSFITSEESYTLVLIDKAGNKVEKVFTTILPLMEVNELNKNKDSITYEINISPFNSDIHTVESFKYLSFNYKEEINEEKIVKAQKSICTSAKKVNCYNEVEIDPKTNLISQTFNRGYSYILLIRVNSVLVKDRATNELTRVDVLEADTIAPVGEYLDDDINPDYISSVSGESFKFSFLASDTTLTSKYRYLVVASSLDSRMDIARFYNLYQNCYGANSSSNSCGLKGENEYVERKDNDRYLAEVTIVANTNTKRRFLNNTMYSLYVLLSDENDNEALFLVRQFLNISRSSVIEYLNDDNDALEIYDGDEITTINTTHITISQYNNIKIQEVTVNGSAHSCDAIRGCDFYLGVGKNEVKVKDELGNVASVVIYSGIANNPVIEVYYLYEGEYFKILDTSFSYNKTGANNIYIKVKGKDIETIEVTMTTTKSYISGQNIFDSLVNESYPYGMKLIGLMEDHQQVDYAGNIVVKAINKDNLDTSITLVVDNDAPVITMSPAGNKINLLGEQVDLLYSGGEYSLTFNYQREITYSYLMEALSLKVDNVAFQDIIAVDRFKMRIDNIAFTNYDDSITKGEKKITLDYFDKAGNGAQTITIKLIVIDSERPLINLTEAIAIAELNVASKLANVIYSDNYDNYDDLILSVKIDGEEIDYTNYKFSAVGEYDVVYTVSDTSSNSQQITQHILVRDTIAPKLQEGTTTTYEIGLEKELEFALPTFIDSDPVNTSYLPYQVNLFDLNGNLVDSRSSIFPIVIDDSSHVVKIRFNNQFRLGTYKLVFTVKDSSNNANEVEFSINLIDDILPTLEVKINNSTIEKDSIMMFAWGSVINISVSAIDNYDGDLTNRITKVITYNDLTIESINSNQSGDYLVEYKVRDNSNNEVIFRFTIRINQDTISPNIDRVFVNDKQLAKEEQTKINGNLLLIFVEASDNLGSVEIKIIVDDIYEMNNSQTINIESGTTSKVYKIEVVVKDSSNNETRETYYIIVDNVNPEIYGVENNNIYLSKVNVSVFDENLENITIYKNGTIYREFATNLDDFEIREVGIYQIICRDQYGNSLSYVFGIKNENSFEIINDGETKTYNYNLAMLIDVEVSNNKWNFLLKSSDVIASSDQIYILVKYPNSSAKYIAYSMNGDTYLNNSSINIDKEIIGGVDNTSLLEKVDNNYYAYVMVVKGSNNGDSASDKKESGVSQVLKYIGLFLITVLGITSILFIIVKLRRRIRAA